MCVNDDRCFSALVTVRASFWTFAEVTLDKLYSMQLGSGTTDPTVFSDPDMFPNLS